MTDFTHRFGGIARLYGVEEAQFLAKAHIAVVGIGGVGSWAAEALARSGVGKITLVDMDDICITNINRQVHSLDSTVGKTKIDAMADRMMEINPHLDIQKIHGFFTEATCDAFFENNFHCVIDAIDRHLNKCILINECKHRRIRIVTTGGAGGRKDPTKIQVADMTKSYNNPLLSKVRRKLRQNFGFSRSTTRSWSIPCVFSPEYAHFPHKDGTVCDTKEEGSELTLDCNSGYGTASFITGTFGFMAAAKAIELTLKKMPAKQ